jgi:transcription elongation GreA/GreB family factor
MNKTQVHERCLEIVNEKILSLQNEFAELKNAMEDESKSSAGDKHEVGTAMLHLQAEKIGTQLKLNEENRATLMKVDVDQYSECVRFGSFISTNKGHFYISTSIGKVLINNEIVFVISSQAPLAKLFLGKRQNEVISFNKVDYKILSFE